MTEKKTLFISAAAFISALSVLAFVLFVNGFERCRTDYDLLGLYSFPNGDAYFGRCGAGMAQDGSSFTYDRATFPDGSQSVRVYWADSKDVDTINYVPGLGPLSANNKKGVSFLVFRKK